MRIAIITNALSSKHGGAGRIAEVYASLLRQRGHDIRVWGPAPWFDDIASTPAWKRLLLHLADLGDHPVHVKEILEWKPDALLTHNLTGCGLSTARTLQSKKIRWVHVLHDVQLVEPSGQVIEGESMPWLHWIWRWCWSNLRRAFFGVPNVVVSPTKWLLEFHRTWGLFCSTETRIIPNPLRLQSVASDKIIGRVVYVGRLAADKGVDVLLDAWKQIDIPQRSLVLIGEGEFHQTILNLEDETISCLGPLSPERVAQEMAQAHIVVVPSRVWENQPTVILEALAAHCQVIASRVGGIEETLEGVGVMVPAGDAHALRQALQDGFMEKEFISSEVSIRILRHHDPLVCVEALEGALGSNLKTETE